MIQNSNSLTCFTKTSVRKLKQTTLFLKISTVLAFCLFFTPVFFVSASMPAPGIQGAVFEDFNNNGVWEKSGTNPEPGLIGINVILENSSSSSIISKIQSGLAGFFDLPNPSNGSYRLKLDIPNEYKLIIPTQGFFVLSVVGLNPVTTDILNNPLIFGLQKKPQEFSMVFRKVPGLRSSSQKILEFQVFSSSGQIISNETPEVSLMDAFGKKQLLTQSFSAKPAISKFSPITQTYTSVFSKAQLSAKSWKTIEVKLGNGQTFQTPLLP